MWEYEIIHNVTEERRIIFGYTLKDAFRKVPSLDPNEWSCLMAEYID